MCKMATSVSYASVKAKPNRGKWRHALLRLLLANERRSLLAPSLLSHSANIITTQIGLFVFDDEMSSGQEMAGHETHIQAVTDGVGGGESPAAHNTGMWANQRGEQTYLRSIPASLGLLPKMKNLLRFIQCKYPTLIGQVCMRCVAVVCHALEKCA